MKYLSRPEEMILYAVWRLKTEVYGVSIQEEIARISGEEWSLGTIYVPLGRLEKKGLLRSVLGEPESRRGGRRKRYYQVTPSGIKELSAARRLQEKMWTAVPELSSEPEG